MEEKAWVMLCTVEGIMLVVLGLLYFAGYKHSYAIALIVTGAVILQTMRWLRWDRLKS